MLDAAAGAGEIGDALGTLLPVDGCLLSDTEVRLRLVPTGNARGNASWAAGWEAGGLVLNGGAEDGTAAGTLVLGGVGAVVGGC